MKNIFELFISMAVAGQISTVELKDIITQEDVILIDVRTKEEVAQGYIPGKNNVFIEYMTGEDRLVNTDFVSQLVGELKNFRVEPDTKLVFICAGGRRSALAIDAFHSVTPACCINFAQGVSGSGGWLKSGFELAKK